MPEPRQHREGWNLLLTDPSGQLLLPRGVDLSALEKAPPLGRVTGVDDQLKLRRLTGHAGDLRQQGWAVIVPAGDTGRKRREAIASLLALRESELQAPVQIYTVETEQDAASARTWVLQHYAPPSRSPIQQQRYLLLLGDLNEISFDLQLALSSYAAVGRIHFPTLDGYREYAAKVVRLAAMPLTKTRPPLRLFAAEDGTLATVLGKRLLLEEIERKWEEWSLPIAGAPDLLGRPDELSAVLRVDQPTLLVSICHGVGLPRGRVSVEEQRRMQGSLALAQNQILSPKDVACGPVLPGGLWISIACFGAGTPRSSAYQPWLEALRVSPVPSGGMDGVLDYLPKAGEPPFLAQLPQALLANPRGPLAIVSHLDLAWTASFTEPGFPSLARADRILDCLQPWAEGQRVGIGMQALWEHYGRVNEELMRGYEEEESARIRGKPVTIDHELRAHQWMLRNDLRGYVLLGDPAVQLKR